MDDYYVDEHGEGRGVAAQLAGQLADPRPKDSSVTRQLDAYRNQRPAGPTGLRCARYAGNWPPRCLKQGCSRWPWHSVT